MKDSTKHSEFIISHSEKILKYFNDKKLDHSQLFIIGLIERLRNVCFIINYTLENILKIPEIEFSCGITIRGILLDILIGLDLVRLLVEAENSKLENDDLVDIIQKYSTYVLSDGLNSMITFLKKSKDYKFLENEKQEVAFKNILKNYGEFFEADPSDGITPVAKSKRRILASQLFDNLASNDETNQLATIYELYLFYSKYDHFSALYFQAFKTPISFKIVSIEKSLRLLLNHQVTLLSLLIRTEKYDTFISEQFRIAQVYAFK